MGVREGVPVASAPAVASFCHRIEHHFVRKGGFALEEWLAEHGYPGDDVATANYCAARHAAAVQASAVTGTGACAITRARAAAAGIKGRFSVHSTRVGAAQLPLAAGAGVGQLQQAGRWQSPSMLANYARG